ncbi:EXO1 [Ecytonucleospora hepatopenaei]|uniref:EXO1 n=1 Tax=Ecytonucleospora hepatopenaei TaxID=646526 RepID=A0A1W0E746_9MICR|nr:EXO1 [Ecytonucleospora hepatopenaei]
MGITGLLPIFKQIMKVKNIKEYKNKRIAIDAFGWIHSIATVVSFEIYNGIETTEHLKIFKNKVNELVKNKIIPIFVFDGDFLEAKKETCEYRKANKLKAKKELQIAIESGDEKRARDLMKRCVEITPSFIYDFMMCLNEMKIEFFIAPYEADAQMAYLSKIKYVDYVMTEIQILFYTAVKIFCLSMEMVRSRNLMQMTWKRLKIHFT